MPRCPYMDFGVAPMTPQVTNIRAYQGCIPNRDATILRPWVNLLPWMSEVENQHQFSDCTAEAIAGALEYLLKRESPSARDEDIDVSRFFIYWVAVMIENREIGHHQKDSSSYTPEAVYGLAKYGVCLEKYWPHAEELEGRQPPPEVFAEASKLKVVPLLVPPHLDSMKRCLNYDLPFVIAFNTALLHQPDMIQINRNYNNNPPDEEVGGHAVLVIGYDDRTQLFLVRNSWGTDWGYGGYFFIPYRYMVDKRFMMHDVVGIWAISCIINRRNLLLRLNNPPYDPSNPFIPLPTDRPIDPLHWYESRYAQIVEMDNALIDNDAIHSPTNSFAKFLAKMELAHPRKLKHYVQNLFV